MSQPSNREIRQTRQWREKSRRRIMAVGRVRGKAMDVAVRCSWCGSWDSLEDRERGRAGAPVSHGICDDCRDQHFGDL